MSDEDWEKFRANMHSRFGYPPDFRDEGAVKVTEKDFEDLKKFHGLVDRAGQWSTGLWVKHLSEYFPTEGTKNS